MTQSDYNQTINTGSLGCFHVLTMVNPLHAESFRARKKYRQVSNIRHALIDNKIVDHPDVVGIACRRCSNYIFILNLTPGFIGLGKDNCKTRREAARFGDLVHPILETLRYLYFLSFFSSEMAQAVETLPQWRQEATFPMWSTTSWLLTAWWQEARAPIQYKDDILPV